MTDHITAAELAKESCQLRRIRSFVRRQGRLTKGQQRALAEVWPLMGVEFRPSMIELTTLFGRDADIVLEIGFGMGTSLVQTAVANPEQNFLAIEVHTPGVGACLASAQAANLTNLRVICHDAVEVLEKMIADNTLDRVQLFFPDPWHKTRHHKRRIVQSSFARLIWQKLKVGGVLHIATDWQNYAEHILAVINEISGYRNLSVDGAYIPRPASRPLTKFEQRGQRLGHGVWDLMFERIEA